MALNKAKLIQDLKDIKNLSTDGVDNTDAALTAIANAIDAFVKSGTVVGSTSGGQTITTGQVL